jgi:hypothetical protein
MARSETAPLVLKLLPQLGRVYDLTVENNPDLFVAAGHGLMAIHNIDNA